VTLYTLAYPDLPAPAARLIRDLREKHDAPYRDVVDFHFTLVFGIEGFDEVEYMRHVRAIAEGQRPISFSCRSVRFHADPESEICSAFLVPEEGYSDLVRLHDRLYTGLLAPHLRADLPFVPHITVATLSEYARVQAICDELNARGLEIAGVVRELTICALNAGRIRVLARVALEK